MIVADVSDRASTVVLVALVVLGVVVGIVILWLMGEAVGELAEWLYEPGHHRAAPVFATALSAIIAGYIFSLSAIAIAGAVLFALLLLIFFATV